jgi:hypothetical protein
MQKSQLLSTFVLVCCFFGVFEAQSTLSVARELLAATSVGKYALFFGGSNPAKVANVDIWDSENNNWNSITLAVPRNQLAATSVGNYSLFGGGEGITLKVSNAVDIWNSVSKAWTSTTLSLARRNLAATSVSKFALFAGGETNNGYSKIVDIWDSGIQNWRQTTTLSENRADLTAVTVNNRWVLFAGGIRTSSDTFMVSAVVDIFDQTIWNTKVLLSQPRRYLASASVGKFAMFFGGSDEDGKLSSTLDIFDSTSWSSTSTSLFSERERPIGISVAGKFIIFAGGNPLTNEMNIWNSQNQTWIRSSMMEARNKFAAVSVGDYALFAGGASNKVDIWNTNSAPSATCAWIGSSCDDNDVCNGQDFCSISGECIHTGFFCPENSVCSGGVCLVNGQSIVVESQFQFSPAIIAAIVAPSVFVVLVIIFILMAIIIRQRRSNNHQRSLSEVQIPSQKNEKYLTGVNVVSKLGSGNFGVVYLGTWENINGNLRFYIL